MHIYTPNELYKISLIKLIYRKNNGTLHVSLREKFILNSEVFCYITRNAKVPHLYYNNMSMFGKSFVYQTQRTWALIPLHVRNIKSVIYI